MTRGMIRKAEVLTGGIKDLGPLSLVLLLVTLCAMSLGLLVTSMAISTSTLAETRAETVRATYQLESAAQEVVADIDGAYASGMAAEDALGVAIGNATNNGGDDPAGRVSVTGSCEDGLIRIRLECGRRHLSAVLEPTSDGMETREWVVGTLPNEEPPLGELL